MGINVALVGAFFSIQETAHLVLRAAGGRLGDYLGYFIAISLGMLMLALALFLLTLSQGIVPFVALAILIGGSQALVFPSTVALAATQVDRHHLGAGMAERAADIAPHKEATEPPPGAGALEPRVSIN